MDNFFARLGHGSPHFCFAGHTDVVTPGDAQRWRAPPFAAEIHQGMLYGRGISDMKGGIAAMVAALSAFLERHPGFAATPGAGTLSLLITGDEEGDAEDGTIKVLEWMATQGLIPDYCLVGEPTSTQVLGDCIKNGRRGSLNGTLLFHGVQGHVAYPHRVRNPIHAAAPVLARLAGLTFDAGNAHFPPSSFQFTGISAGDGSTNVVPATLEARFNIRFNTEQTPATLEERLRQALSPCDLPLTLTLKLSGLPFASADGPLLAALRQA
ncbi:MAG: succinyl-diaminopimelate desuccinylase, partial [Magnetococcus sp. WYHC-3]